MTDRPKPVPGESETLLNATRSRAFRLHDWNWKTFQKGMAMRKVWTVALCVVFLTAAMSWPAVARRGPAVIEDLPTQVLKGHRGPVLTVAFSPDGALVASGGGIFDRTIRTWNALTGAHIATSGTTDYQQSSVVFRPDGQTLVAVAWRYGEIRFLDPGRGETLHLFRAGSPVHAIALNPDGGRFALGTAGGTVDLWDSEALTRMSTLTGHSEPVRSVAFSPDGRLLASASDDRTIRIWDAEHGRTLHELTDHTAGVRSVAFSPDGRLLASGSDDRTVRLWDVETGALVKTLTGHGWHVTSVAFSRTGAYLASACADGRIILWDVAAREALGTLHEHLSSVTSVAFSPTANVLASGSGDHTVILWDLTGLLGEG